MRLSSGVAVLSAAIIAVGALGAAIDAGVGDVPQVDAIDLGEGRFETSTRLCPPAPNEIGALWVASGAEAARVALEPREQETTPLAPLSLLRREAAARAVDVVGYDAPVTASAALTFGSPPGGAGAAVCAVGASDRWYFAHGSTENGFSQRIILYNPFPEEASVRITLYTQNRTRAPALLADLPVSANEYSVVNFVERTDPSYGPIGAEVVASRGRVVAWRSMVVRADDRPQGAEFSLGASQTALQWFFPAGTSADGSFTSVRVLNPNAEEASVQVSLATPQGRIEHPGLEQIVIPPTSSRPLDLQRVLRRENIPDSFGVIVRSSVPVVAERTIGSSGDDAGRSSEVGAVAPATAWTLPPVGIAATDDRLILLNPGDRRAEVAIALTRLEGPPLQPETLRIEIPRGQTREVPLERWQGQAPFAAVVDATRPIVVERAARWGNDAASAIGVPTSGG